MVIASLLMPFRLRIGFIDKTDNTWDRRGWGEEERNKPQETLKGGEHSEGC